MSVHLKISDRNWILETMAKQLASRLDYISYDTSANAQAAIQYYLTYSTYAGRVSPTELAYFTHLEDDANAAKKFFEVANAVEHSVCMSNTYKHLLNEKGIQNAHLIPPGVDTARFDVKLRIGVVGRTYATGRKGEALVAQLMDMPGITWCFTGSGWPGPAMNIPDAEMPEFYRSLDYVLVPAKYEGGPMSAIEALACGVEVIAPPIGWIPELPHIPYALNDAGDLRRVLNDLLDKKRARREAVTDRTWDAFAAQHDKLFRSLVPDLGKPKQSARAVQKKASVALITHGHEGKALGGPSVRVPATQKALEALGVPADMMMRGHPDAVAASNAPVAHVYNIWKPNTCYEALVRAKAAGKRTVLSPIFMNLGLLPTFSDAVPNLLRNSDQKQMDRALEALHQSLISQPNLPTKEPYFGFHDEVRACVALADHLVFLSEYERSCLEHIGADVSKGTVIRNPVEFSRFEHADPNLFRERYELDDYILCVGRLETRKNQALLAEAARRLETKVVFIGHDGDPGYARLVKERAGEFGVFVPRIEPDDPLLPSAFAGARVFCLPSWSEGAPLAALEAAACGTNMVLSDRSSEREYFGDLARYVNPADLSGLCSALQAAMKAPADPAPLIATVREKYSWDKHAKATAKVYQSLKPFAPANAARSTAPRRIFIDVTDKLYASDKPTGVPRVVEVSTLAAVSDFDVETVLVRWRKGTTVFETVDKFDYLSGRAQKLMNAQRLRGEVITADDLTDQDTFLSMGGGWASNTQHAIAIMKLGGLSPARMVVLVHDLARWKLGHLYDPVLSQLFEENLLLLCEWADDFLVYSEATRHDLTAFMAEHGTLRHPITKFTMGDTKDPITAPQIDATVQSRFESLKGRPYVLFVSTFDPRKNHRFLLDVWRRLAETNGQTCPKLVFVGRGSGHSRALMGQVQRDKVLSRHVVHFENVTDAELNGLYANAAFTVYPSIHEGWGLPVAESLSLGKMCITSSGTSTEEVAPEFADALDPYDINAWVSRIALYVNNPALLEQKEAQIAAGYSIPTWSAAMSEIAGTLVPRSKPFLRFRTLYENTHFDLSTPLFEPASNILLAGGWNEPVKDGVHLINQSGDLLIPVYSDRTLARLMISPASEDEADNRAITITVDMDGTEILSRDIDTATPLDVPVGQHASASQTHARLRISARYADSADGSKGLLYLRSVTIASSVDSLNALATKPAIEPKPKASHAVQPSVGQGGLWNARLQELDAMLTLPTRLPDTRLAFRILRAAQIDRLLLKLYGRIFARTNNALRILSDLEKDK